LLYLEKRIQIPIINNLQIGGEQVKKQFVMIFVAIVMSIFIVQGVFAENGGLISDDPVYVEEDFDIDLEVDEQNVFVLGPGESLEDYAPVLGSATSDLVFTPVTPCRIIDTRSAGGIINANTGRQFQVNMSNYSSQGGFAGSCNIPINPAAVAINVASTQQTGNGHIRVIVTGGGVPNAAMLNYRAGTNISNAAVVRSLETGVDDIFIYSGVSATHVVSDIMGYFAPPKRTMPDTVRMAKTQSIAAGATVGFDSPSCPAGYARTGGNCNPGNSYRLIMGDSWISVSGHYMHCNFRNPGPGAATAYANVVCTRIPGR